MPTVSHGSATPQYIPHALGATLAVRTARAPERSAYPEFVSKPDLSLLLAALDEIQSRRQSLEWLVEADLLWRCLV
jgi:hypothetical protein